MIRVVVAEDSPTARALIVGVLSAEPDIQVVGEARTGNEAVELAERLAPDLVTMDIHMPGVDGIEATRQIMTRSPRPILVVSSAADADVGMSLDATRAGALMVIAKPQGGATAVAAGDGRQLVSMVRALAAVKVVRRHGATALRGGPAMPGVTSITSPRATPAFVPPVRRAPGEAVQVVAIAASTGGPEALRTVLAGLGGPLPVPILVVQHIARGFTAGLAHWLSGATALTVKLAELGEPARGGVVFVAPDDRHLGVRRDAYGALRIQLDPAPPIGSFRPSATYLFRSCAETAGAGLVAVICTGMGDDGVDGLRDVRRFGGRVLSQDEASSVIFGMPREAQRAGVVDEVLPLGSLARRLRELAS